MLLIVALVFGGMVLFYFTGPIGVAVAVGAYFLWAWFSTSSPDVPSASSKPATTTSRTETKRVTKKEKSEPEEDPYSLDYCRRQVSAFVTACNKHSSGGNPTQAELDRMFEGIASLYVKNWRKYEQGGQMNCVEIESYLDMVEGKYVYDGSRYPHMGAGSIVIECCRPVNRR